MKNEVNLKDFKFENLTKEINSTGFKSLFYNTNYTKIKWQETPLQVYPLKDLCKEIQWPTPLLKVDYNFLILVTAGKIEVQIGNEIIYAVKDTIVFVNASTILSIKSISADLEGYFVLMEDKVMSFVFSNDTSLNLFNIQSNFKIEEKASFWIASLCELMYLDLSSEKSNCHIGHGLVLALLNKVIELSYAVKVQHRTDEIAGEFKILVYKNYQTERSLGFYANALSISENYLNRCVKSVYNKGAKEIILEIVILNSQLKMWNGTRSISEISYELNFEDPSYFSRLFKKIVGQTPLEYQKHILNQINQKI